MHLHLCLLPLHTDMQRANCEWIRPLCGHIKQPSLIRFALWYRSVEQTKGEVWPKAGICRTKSTWLYLYPEESEAECRYLFSFIWEPISQNDAWKLSTSHSSFSNCTSASKGNVTLKLKGWLTYQENLHGWTTDGNIGVFHSISYLSKHSKSLGDSER